MRCIKLSLAKRLPRGLAVLLIIALCAAQIAAAPAQQPRAAELVRFTAEAGDDASAWAALGLAVYARLEIPNGGFILIAEATPKQQAELTRLGYKVESLANARSQSGDLYLLYALPEQLRRADKQVRLLAAAGRQAVAVATGEQIEALERQGIGALYLTPQMSLPEAVQPSAQASALAPAVTYSPIVQQMVNDIRQNMLYNYVSLLSGEIPATIDGAPYSLVSRYTLNSQAINKATLFGYEHFAALGLPVDFDYFNFNYGGSSYQRRNVVAQQTGLTQPNRIFLLTGHLDSYAGGASYSSAPGADDNASGSAAVMAIADVLSKYHTACTVRYVLFTGEELGLFGSYAYAAQVDALNENIEGVLNLDMLGYNTLGSARQIELHTRPGNSGDLYIANLFSQAVGAYSLNVAPVILQDSLSFSDHKPFWDRGYPAILAIEDWADHTPAYHTVNDRVNTFDMGYYTAFVKAAMATFAHMGCLLDGAASGVVRDSSTGSPIGDALVGIAPSGGETVYQYAASDGSFWKQLIQGAYSARFSAEDHRTVTIPSFQVNGYQAAVLNPLLEPCATVKNLAASPALVVGPAGAPLTFEAAAGSGQAPLSYAWYFGDGGSATGAEVQHTFTAPGAYSITLWANNSCDYPVSTGGLALIGVTPVYLPLVGN